MRSLPFLLFFCLVFALILMLSLRTQPVKPGATSEVAMPVIAVTSLDGKVQWDANALKGKVTLVNFFASWCQPCITEMPELAALKKQFPGLRMDGIAWNDTPEKLKPWLKKHGEPFKHVWLDAKGDSLMKLGIRGIPETVLIDHEGMIRYRLSGPLMQDMREGEFGALVQKLLDEAHAK